LISAAPIKRQIIPTKAARTGAPPLRKAITSAPQLSGQAGRTANTVKAIKIKPIIMWKILIKEVIILVVKKQL